MRIWGAWKVREPGFILAMTASLATGCARDRGPVRVNGFSRSSTLGSDLRAVPRGVTVPPPSLGVDLVRGHDDRLKNDPEAVKAGTLGADDRAR